MARVTKASRRATQRGVGGRQRLAGNVLSGAEMDVATVERLMVGLRADMGEARDAGSWAALSSMHRMERAYEIDLHASRKAEAAEAEARRAAALAGTDSAALFESIVAAIRSLPDVDRERLLAEVVGPAPLRVVV